MTSVVAVVAFLLIGGMFGSAENTVDVGPNVPTASVQSVVETASPGENGAVERMGADNCLSGSLLDSHPVWMAEAERLAPYMVISDAMAVYRDLTESDLRHLIDQGDSGAMAVLGAMHFMRASGYADSMAVSYLMLEDPGVKVRRARLPQPAERKQHLELAAEWFYKSALHGRLMALINYGDQLDMMGQNPVTLGWISEEDYDLVTRAHRSIFNAANVYQGVVYTIAPELEIGFYDEENAGFGTGFARRFADIAEPIAEKFRADRRELGFDPLVVPASELPSTEEVRKIMCGRSQE